MKLRLEFEDSDLREMIHDYFDRNGFAVKNLDQLCELFKKAFPDGIKVDAETLGPQEKTTPVSKAKSTQDIPESEVEAVDVEDLDLVKNNGKPNMAMSATDLFDPTPGLVPTRDEQLHQSQAEVARIVAQSKVLEEAKAREDS